MNGDECRHRRGRHRRGRSGRTHPGPGERGFTLILAIVLVTVLSVYMAMAIRPLRTTDARIKEAELLYRGQHIATGIRRFYIKYGRFPYELDELIDEEPRFVRRIYKDPMTRDGEWTYVYLGQGDIGGVRLLNSLARRLLAGEEEEQNSQNQGQNGLDRSAGGKDPKDNLQSLFNNKNQITGIRSKSDTEGLTVFQDSRIYSDWLFSALPQPELNTEDAIDLLRQLSR